MTLDLSDDRNYVFASAVLRALADAWGRVAHSAVFGVTDTEVVRRLHDLTWEIHRSIVGAPHLTRWPRVAKKLREEYSGKDEYSVLADREAFVLSIEFLALDEEWQKHGFRNIWAACGEPPPPDWQPPGNPESQLLVLGFHSLAFARSDIYRERVVDAQIRVNKANDRVRRMGKLAARELGSNKHRGEPSPIPLQNATELHAKEQQDDEFEPVLDRIAANDQITLMLDTLTEGQVRAVRLQLEALSRGLPFTEHLRSLGFDHVAIRSTSRTLQRAHSRMRTSQLSP